MQLRIFKNDQDLQSCIDILLYIGESPVCIILFSVADPDLIRIRVPISSGHRSSTGTTGIVSALPLCHPMARTGAEAGASKSKWFEPEPP